MEEIIPDSQLLSDANSRLLFDEPIVSTSSSSFLNMRNFAFLVIVSSLAYSAWTYYKSEEMFERRKGSTCSDS